MSVQDWMPPGVDKYEYSERYFGTDRTQPAKLPNSYRHFLLSLCQGRAGT